VGSKRFTRFFGKYGQNQLPCVRAGNLLAHLRKNIKGKSELTLPLFFDNLLTSLIEGVSIGSQVPEMSF
jgi:hypothetical protein